MRYASSVTCKLFSIFLSSCLSCFGLAVQLPKDALAQTPQCESLNGTWAWDTRAFTAILVQSDTGGLRGNISAIDGDNNITATWQCDPSTNTVEVNWSSNITDRLTVRRNALVGTNSLGRKVVVIRQSYDDTGEVIGGCPETIVGDWAWDNRAFPATIFSNGSVVGNDGSNIITADWTCLNSEENQIQVNWSTGHVDTLELSNDQNRLVGENQRRPLTVQRRLPLQNSQAQVTGDLIVTGRIYARDGKRFRPDIRKENSINWSIPLRDISSNLQYFNTADTCASEVVGTLYTTAQRDLQSVAILLAGTAYMRHGSCSPSFANHRRLQHFQCYVPPEQETSHRIRFSHHDDIVHIDFTVKNSGTIPNRFQTYSPAQCFEVSGRPY